jgi:protein SDA1
MDIEKLLKCIYLQFLQQQQHYKSTLEVFCLEPTQYNKSLDDLVIFLAQVSIY